MANAAPPEDTVAFQLQLPVVKKLVLRFYCNAGGKIERIKESLDEGISNCIKMERWEVVAGLIEDLKDFDAHMEQRGFFQTEDDGATVVIRLTIINETARQMMLANRIKNKLKNLLPNANKHSTSKAVPVKAPKEPALAKLRLHQPKTSTQVQKLAAAAESESGDSSAFDSKEDLRKTFYTDNSDDDSTNAEKLVQNNKREEFRYKNAMEELIVTEQRFVEKVNYLHDYYLTQLIQSLPSNSSSTRTIVEKLESIQSEVRSIKQFHQILLEDLEKMSEEAKGDPLKFRVGFVMKKKGQALCLHNDYNRDYQLNTQLITSDWSKLEPFASHFKDLQSRDKKTLGMVALMLEIPQRAMRYPLLIHEYIKELQPDHPDLKDAKEAWEIVKAVTHGSEKSIAEVEKFSKMLQILSELHFKKDFHKERDKFATGTFIRQNTVLKISSKNQQQIRHLVLSDEYLLICEQRGLNGKSVQRVIDIKKIRISLDQKLSADYDNCFHIETDKKSYDISFKTPKIFEDWVADFEKLGVEFNVHANEQNEKFPWAALSDDDFGVKAPDWLKDQDVSQCQGCRKEFNIYNRRHHCRLCGGLFCNMCCDYKHYISFLNVEQRVCFFCKDRIVKKEGKTCAVLEQHHRDIITTFNKREVNFEQPLIQGYLEIKVQVENEKACRVPNYLYDWRKMWCSVDREVFNAYRMKKDLKHAYQLVLPMEVKVSWSDDTKNEIQAKLKNLQVCHLRLTSELAARSVESEASQLQDWFNVLNEATQLMAGN